MRTLYDHQERGVEWLVKTRKAILADDMGTGKTATALAAAKQVGLHALVICPPGLRTNWEEEARAMECVVEISSDNRMPKAPKSIDFVLIGDEAHRYQSLKSQRTQAMLGLAMQPNCKAVFLLTGTPMRNGRPANLYPLLRAIGHPLGRFKNQFEKKYCGAQWKPFGKVKPDLDLNDRLVGFWWKCSCGKANRSPMNWQNPFTECTCGRSFKRPLIIWDNGGATNLEELKAQIDPVILRRRKEECLELPSKTRVYRQADITEKAAEVFKAVFDQSLSRFREKVEAGHANAESESLVLLIAMRKAASTAKVHTAIEMIEDICEEGGRVIVFCEFKDTARAIAEHFDAMPFTGDTSMNERDEIVKAFQQGEQNVFIGTSGAGGLGLNLTAANHVLMVDRPMTPGDTLQAEDRCYRIGQHWPVTIHWLRAFEVDKRIDEMLIEKLKTVDAILGGQFDVPISAAKILKTIFADTRKAKRKEKGSPEPLTTNEERTA